MTASRMLVVGRFTFGCRYKDPYLAGYHSLDDWWADQIALRAPPFPGAAVSSFNQNGVALDHPEVTNRFNLVRINTPQVTDAEGNPVAALAPLLYVGKPLDATKLWTLLDLADAVPSQSGVGDGNIWLPATEVVTASWIRAAFSPLQLQEVMVDFWHNHFSVPAFQAWEIATMYPLFDQALRNSALGNFGQMLLDVTRSAAMMHYLNQADSGPPSSNENYARELMELFSLGIACYNPSVPVNGYRESDVKPLADLLTGWTIDTDTGLFTFDPESHISGAKTVLGTTYGGGASMQDGLEIIARLAAHWGTAYHVANKLYVHFVSDAAPALDLSRPFNGGNSASDLVNSMARTFKANAQAPDQLAQVLTVLYQHPEFAASDQMKLKTPFQYAVSVIRASGAELGYNNTPNAAGVLPNPSPWAGPDGTVTQLAYEMDLEGAPLYNWPFPNGLPDVAAPYLGTNGLASRWTLADQWPTSGSDGLNYLVDRDPNVPNGTPSLFSSLPANGSVTLDSAIASLQSGMFVPNADGRPPLSSASLGALRALAQIGDVWGQVQDNTSPDQLQTGARGLFGAIITLPEFHLR